MKLRNKDYCPRCRRVTLHVKDWDGSKICKQCGFKESAIKFQNFKL